MLCYNINADVLLANLFACTKSYPAEYSMQQIHSYCRFLSEACPVYVHTDLSEESVHDCGDKYPEAYTVYRNESGETAVRSGKFRPNLEHFHGSYREGMRHFMITKTRDFLDSLDARAVCQETSV